MSFSSMPGISAVISYALSVSETSTAGAAVNVAWARRGARSKNGLRNGERQKPPSNSSNRRSTSRRRLSNGRSMCGIAAGDLSVFTGTLLVGAMSRSSLWLNLTLLARDALHHVDVHQQTRQRSAVPSLTTVVRAPRAARRFTPPIATEQIGADRPHGAAHAGSVLLRPGNSATTA